MAKLITNVVQSGGEITVNIVLTVKLEGDVIKVASESEKIQEEKEEEKPNWIIPNFENLPIIEQFGKKEE